MPVTDEELVRQLESVPLVEPPDFREAVMSRVKAHRPAVKFRPATPRLYLGLAWAAAWFWWFRDDPHHHEGVNRAEETLREYVVTLELRACFDDALTFIRSSWF